MGEGTLHGHMVTNFLFGDDLSKQVKDLKDEQKATSGVMKSQGRFARPRQFSHPYRDNNRPRSGDYQYRRAGWTTRPRPEATRPNFLGRRPYRGPQNNRSAPSTQNKGKNFPTQNQRKQ